MRVALPNFKVGRALVAALLCVLLVTSGASAQVSERAESLVRVAALVGSDRLDEAERQLNQILKAAPEEAVALNLLGAVRAKQRRFDEAEALFARAVKADERLTGARMNLAYLYLLTGRAEKSAAQLSEVLRLEPANPEAAHRLAWLLFSQNRTDEGIALVEKLKQTQTPAAPVLALLGDAYMKKGDASNAETNYLLALERQGHNPDALIGLAQVAQSRGDAKAAALHLGRARDFVTNSPDHLQKLARVALSSDLKNEATAALRRAVELRPDDPAYHFALGSAWLCQPPDLQEAEQAFRRALSLRPEDAQAQLHLGYVLLKQKRHAEAAEWLGRTVQKGAATPEAFYYLGLVAQAQGEDARAVELFSKAVQSAPSFAHAHAALGSAYLKLKDYERARQSLETAVKLSPEDSKARYNLAMLYARLKQPERAREEMLVVERLRSEGKAREDEGETVAPPPQR